MRYKSITTDAKPTTLATKKDAERRGELAAELLRPPRKFSISLIRLPIVTSREQPTVIPRTLLHLGSEDVGDLRNSGKSPYPGTASLVRQS